MRVNDPVTQRELELADDATLMSITDTASRITYANASFVDISGFSGKELHGQPHNIIRHPDMPQQAFADMWATLKGGEPWTALVKNRRKNGDHYWVRANATPVVRGGETVGYMSVRTKPSREEVAAAERLYSDFREGRAGSRRFHKGLIVSGGWRALGSLAQTLPVRWHIRAAMSAMLTISIGTAVAAGVGDAALSALAAVATVAGLLTSYWLEAHIARPLAQLREQALRVASGDGHHVAHMDRVDEIGMTLRAIGQLGLMSRWLVDDVRAQVDSLQNASGEIAQGNQHLSARTEQAAGSVQQTASSMAQMTATVQGNADRAAQVNHLSGSASAAARRGGAALSKVVSTMNEISRSSRRIAAIIGVIDDIAFQTNILALNAAVEAARAGEQGRGFAIVAGEVRSLAQRSATAASEIKSLIGASVDKVEAGTALVDGAGKAMNDIVSQVSCVSELIAEISAATTEQSSGITQVGRAIGALDQIVQENAALVEQSAAASAALKRQAQHLAAAVSVFC